MIICCGEALIDMLPRELADESSSGFMPVSGGAIFNTAIALGRQGVDAALLCGISNDMFGEQLMASLKASNVSPAFTIRSNQPCTLAFVKLTDGVADYSFFDENSAMRMLDYVDVPALPSKAEALQFGGISLTSDPSAGTYEQVLMQAEANAVIAIDPNIRTGFIRDEQSYRERLQRMIAKSDIVKVSDEDSDWLYPNEAFDAVARRWLDEGVSVVLQTLGSKGARAITSSVDVTVPSEKVEVVDTVGAGDTFNAGMLVWLEANNLLDKNAIAQLSETNLVSALKFAASIAAYTVGQAGANPPWKEQLSV